MSADPWTTSLLKSTVDTGVIILSVDGEILAWLGAAERLFGHTAAQAVGMPISRLFTPEDVEAQLDRQERELALSAGRSEDDRWHLRRDGSRFWGSGVMERLFDEQGRVIGLSKILRDRTDVRTLVVALQNRMQAAEEQNQRQLATVASLAHELRNQVSPLSNLLGVLEKTAGDQPATAGMRRQLQLMARLLDDLAEGAAVAAAAPLLSFSRVHVQEVIVQAAAGMAAHCEKRGQTLKVTLPDAPIVIDADRQRLDQILINLLSNASKYTPAGGHVQVSATIEDDMAVLRVEDDGAGIAADVLPKIFELFTRESRDDAPRGLGVGLSVVKRLAELHSGFIEGRSLGHDRGSVFTLRLPMRQPAPAPAPA